MTYFNWDSPSKPENKASDLILAIGTTTGLWHDVPAQFAQNSAFLCESDTKTIQETIRLLPEEIDILEHTYYLCHNIAVEYIIYNQ